jgi:hypothetical protein
MAKRLTDTDKWKDEWFVSLSNDDRIVWQWLLDNCSHAGFCKRSMSILNLMCQVNYVEDEMIQKMDSRVLIIANDWFIPKFIKFQYSSLLNAKPVILSVVRELFQRNCIGIIPESFGNDYKIISESFDNHYRMIKDKDKDKDKDKVLGAKNSEISNGAHKGDPGKKFSDNGKGVVFEDGIYQPFGFEQKIAYDKGNLNPRDVKRGLIY